MPPSQDLINIRQKYGLSPTGYKAPNPLLGALQSAWGGVKKEAHVANDAAKMLVSEGLPGITSDKPIPSSWKDALRLGLQDRGELVQKDFSKEHVGETATGFVGGMAPKKAIDSVVPKVVDEAKNVAPKVFEGFHDITTKVLERLKGKSVVSKEHILNETNRPDLKQTERDLIRRLLDEHTTEGEVLFRGEKPMTAPKDGVVYEGGIPEVGGGTVNALGDATYLSPHKTVAEKYATGGGKVGAYRANLKNPLVLDSDAAFDAFKIDQYSAGKKIPNPLDPMIHLMGEKGGVAKAAAEFQKAIREAGYDGVVVNLDSGKRVDELTKLFEDSQTVVFDKSALKEHSDQIHVPDFAEKVRAELLPLERTPARNLYSTEKGEVGGRYESVNLPDELRGPVADYKEHIYQSPIKTSAGDVHFGQPKDKVENYFGHTRVEDLPNMKELEYEPSNEAYYDKEGNIVDPTEAEKSGTTRRVIEVQSDLFQKGRLESEKGAQAGKEIRYKGRKYQVEGYDGEGGVNLTDARTGYSEYIPVSEYEKLPEIQQLSKLEPYKNNAAHFRMIREEVKQAALDGKTKLQFPTGETAMKIEGLGQQNFWFLRQPDGMHIGADLTPESMKVGTVVTNAGNGARNEGTDWIITDVLGDGKFKAITKRDMERANGLIENKQQYIDASAETFDISGKVDTENPIYKFYEKEVGKYLKSNYNAQLITDPQGVKWWELDVKPEAAKKPVEAFGILPLLVAPTINNGEHD